MIKRARTKSAIEALDYLVAESGFLPELVTADDLAHALEAYRSVRHLIESRSERSHEYTLAHVLPVFDDLTRGVAALPVRQGKAGAGVQLMSLHKSKGLEFDHVFLPHALLSRFKPRADRSLFFIPPYVNQPEASQDDERRLFYVGITRARTHAYVSLHEKRSDGKEEVPLSFIADLLGVEEKKVEAASNTTVVPAKRAHGQYRAEYDAIVVEFLEHGISATALNNYLQDPWECFFSSILKIPRAKEAPQLYGTAIHAALERFFTRYKEEGVKDKDFLVESFTSALRRASLSPKDRTAYLEKGTKSLEQYFDEYEATMQRSLDTEVAVKADLPLPDGSSRPSVLVHGFLDKIEYSDGDSVRVVDYKTGSPKSRNHIEGKTKDADGNYKRQLVFYKLLLTREGKHSMSEGVIDFVEPNDSGKHKREAFIITDEEVATLTQEIATMVDDLVRGDFLTKTSASEDAEVRALALLMQKRFSS
jgi:DNA helicase-2/ATP-dependent DNA helicase PcrA